MSFPQNSVLDRLGKMKLLCNFVLFPIQNFVRWYNNDTSLKWNVSYFIRFQYIYPLNILDKFQDLFISVNNFLIRSIFHGVMLNTVVTRDGDIYSWYIYSQTRTVTQSDRIGERIGGVGLSLSTLQIAVWLQSEYKEAQDTITAPHVGLQYWAICWQLQSIAMMVLLYGVTGEWGGYLQQVWYWTNIVYVCVHSTYVRVYGCVCKRLQISVHIGTLVTTPNHICHICITSHNHWMHEYTCRFWLRYCHTNDAIKPN